MKKFYVFLFLITFLIFAVSAQHENNQFSTLKNDVSFEIVMEDFFYYDSEGNLEKIVTKSLWEDDTVFFNAKGYIFHSFHSDEFFSWESWNEFDENDNLIHSYDTTGFEMIFEYDDNNHLLVQIDDYGDETRYEYDSFGRVILVDDPYMGQIKTEYDLDSDGTVLGKRVFQNDILFEEIRYDADGNEIYGKYGTGYGDSFYDCCFEYEFDSKGQILNKKKIANDGTILEEYGYDIKGNLLFINRFQENVELHEYDSNGNEVYQKFYNVDDELTEYWMDYEYDSFGNISKRTTYKKVSSN